MNFFGEEPTAWRVHRVKRGAKLYSDSSDDKPEPTAKAIEALCNDDPDLSVGEAREILRRGTEP